MDGRVLVAGGVFAEIYDPETDTFSITGTKITLSDGFVKTLPPGWLDPSSATLLLNGTVLFDGGDGDSGPASGLDLRPFERNIFGYGQHDHPTVGGYNYFAARRQEVLMTGSYRVGGFPNSLNPGAVASAEVYDPGTGAFTSTQDMTVSRFGHTATLLNGGKVLVTGGTSGEYPGYLTLSSAELYTPPALVAAPALFSLSADGKGQGAIWHSATRQVASANNPAIAGEALSMYTSNLTDRGAVPPQVAIGGRLAEILFFGAAPGYPGYFQVNFRVPDRVAPGSAVPVRLTYLDRPSNEVSISVQ